mgnify:CR=1 FL=1
MIIIPKDKISRELDTIVMTIRFDDLEGNIREETKKVKASTLLNMTEEEIVDAVKNFVANRRLSLAEDRIKEKLSGLIDVDLEAE